MLLATERTFAGRSTARRGDDRQSLYLAEISPTPFGRLESRTDSPPPFRELQTWPCPRRDLLVRSLLPVTR